MPNPFEDADVIHVVTRAQLVADGSLIDVSETGRECGFRWPLAITAQVHQDLESIPAWAEGIQSYAGRLWDLCWMAMMGMRRKASRSGLSLTPENPHLRIPYQVILSVAEDPCPEDTGKQNEKVYDLVAEVDEALAPVLTIARHGED